MQRTVVNLGMVRERKKKAAVSRYLGGIMALPVFLAISRFVCIVGDAIISSFVIRTWMIVKSKHAPRLSGQSRPESETTMTLQLALFLLLSATFAGWIPALKLIRWHLARKQKQQQPGMQSKIYYAQIGDKLYVAPLPNQTSLDRARGQVAVLQAFAQAITDVRPLVVDVPDAVFSLDPANTENDFDPFLDSDDLP